MSKFILFFHMLLVIQAYDNTMRGIVQYAKNEPCGTSFFMAAFTTLAFFL